MGGRLPWRRVEDDVLLRAWARVGAVPLVAQAQDALWTHYEALCSHARIRCHRSAKALSARKNALERMHEFICAFHDWQQAAVGIPIPTTAASGSSGVEADAAFRYSSGDWFALAAWEQQHWVATLSTACGVFVDMKKYQFDEIDAILKAADGNEERPRRYVVQAMATTSMSTASVPTNGEHPSNARLADEFVRTMIKQFISRETSSADLRCQRVNVRSAANGAHFENASSASEPLANEYGRTMVERFTQEDVAANPLTLNSCRVDVESASAEIDVETNSLSWWDEIVPRSPIAAAIGETSGKQQEPTLGVDGKGNFRDTSAWRAGSIKIQQHKCVDVWRGARQQNDDLQSERFTPTKKRRRQASDHSLLDGVFALETESEMLSALVLRELKERESDAHDRAMFAKMIDAYQVERDRVLDEIKRSEDAIRRERDEWTREKEEMRHELGRMRERLVRLSDTQRHDR